MKDHDTPQLQEYLFGSQNGKLLLTPVSPNHTLWLRHASPSEGYSSANGLPPPPPILRDPRAPMPPSCNLRSSISGPTFGTLYAHAVVVLLDAVQCG
jgi:hypothetical protein